MSEPEAANVYVLYQYCQLDSCLALPVSSMPHLLQIGILQLLVLTIPILSLGNNGNKVIFLKLVVGTLIIFTACTMILMILNILIDCVLFNRNSWAPSIGQLSLLMKLID